ncbi:Pyrrolo-quinoline quinone [Parvibaculum lavamentivorans DS-1]|uniref:Pyrrolo-quinoline quinone n=1 Tax=Parvibaculum lavamentivorans (strain DS-1 / DSM 13023 / NCIMB 13966) TaxID=402881 RepID=A7HXM9_PARL1|nr:membrane-bound PQQ-dependent dehydrogenase, glucose/quinate/shikimate family [Parvibaculum lavamentivorans]ABS64662.1 Pyrrolo-quinoline quinone [Parvibaculum lavamentivorans DS-1]
MTEMPQTGQPTRRPQDEWWVPEKPRRGFGWWWSGFIGAVIALTGLLLAGGGFWLLLLGGSWYYVIVGIALTAAGLLMMFHDMAGLWTYLAAWLFTLAWAYWEAGLEPWAQVPRLVAPTVLLLLALTAIPGLRKPRMDRRYPSSGTALSILVLLGLGGALLLRDVAPPAFANGGQRQQSMEPVEEGGNGGENIDMPPEVTAAPTTAVEADRIFSAGADWPAYGGSNAATRHSPLTQITPENVSRLREVWTYRSGDMPSEAAAGEYAPENTPLKIGNNLYHCTAKNIMVALDAATGEEIWRHDPEVPDAAIPYGATCRGVAYYEAPQAAAGETCATRIMEATLDARLIAVDAATGAPCPGFGENGTVDLNEGIGETVPGWYSVTSPPTIVRGIAVVGAQVKDGQAEDAPSGVIRGYDAVSGELAWAWDMGRPDRKGAPPEGETYTRGTPNMWTIAAGDSALGLVYLPMGNSSVDYWGADRADYENEYSTSLVALDVTTGDVAWHFQTVHYDVWDYDLGSQPTLIDLPTEDGAVPALILSSKQGPIYVLNRATGAPLFPVEERPVPQGGVEPENLSPTQPYSSYATLSKERLTESDMWGMTPLDQLWCRIQFRRASYEGEYTPPTADRRFIQYPGYNGGSDWGSVAVDTERGILIANYNDMPNFNRLIPREEADEMGLKGIHEGGGEEGEKGSSSSRAEGEGDAQAGAPYAVHVNAGWRMPTGLLCKKPPYGHIRAIELATGKTIWDRPLGSAENNGPFGIPTMLPFTIGTPNNGGPLLTAGGLIFIAATTDDKFRAIDIATGETLWETKLPAGGQTTPITYEVEGRQYIAIAPGGHHFMETKIGDYVIAYALPED